MTIANGSGKHCSHIILCVHLKVKLNKGRDLVNFF